jgi:hypothetical protein
MRKKYQQLDAVDNQSEQQRSLFYDYQQTVADFAQKLKVFGATVEPLIAEAKQSKIAEQELINLTQSPEFIRFIEFPDQLIDLTSQTAQKLNRVERELLQAEKFRAQIATTSLLLSMAIAFLAVVYLSRAIASVLRMQHRSSATCLGSGTHLKPAEIARKLHPLTNSNGSRQHGDLGLATKNQPSSLRSAMESHFGLCRR